MTRIRRGHDIRLIIPSAAVDAIRPAARNDRLVSILAEAMAAREVMLASPDCSINQLAARLGQCRKRLTRLIQLSWLAPSIVEAILNGWQPTSFRPAAGDKAVISRVQVSQEDAFDLRLPFAVREGGARKRGIVPAEAENRIPP